VIENMLPRDGKEPATPAFSGLDSPICISFNPLDLPTFSEGQNSELLGPYWDHFFKNRLQGCVSPKKDAFELLPQSQDIGPLELSLAFASGRMASRRPAFSAPAFKISTLPP